MTKDLVISLRNDYEKRKFPYKIRLATNAFYVFSDRDTLLWNDDDEYVMCIRRNPHSYDSVYGKELEAQIVPYEYIEFICVDLELGKLKEFLQPEISSGKITEKECNDLLDKYSIIQDPYLIPPAEKSYSPYPTAHEVNKNLRQTTP